MSGSFLDIDVPPTLVAFAVCPTDAREIISNEFKAAGHKLVLVAPRYDNNNLPDFEDLKDKYEKINKLIKSGKVYSANAIGQDGAFELAKPFGNKIGMKLINSDLFKPLYGAIVLEVDEEIGFGEVIGETIDDENIICGTAKITIDEAIKCGSSL